jgi:hypothetical protein
LGLLADALTAVNAGESVVPASELAAARARIAQLQRMLGKKTMVLGKSPGRSSHPSHSI